MHVSCVLVEVFCPCVGTCDKSTWPLPWCCFFFFIDMIDTSLRGASTAAIYIGAKRWYSAMHPSKGLASTEVVTCMDTVCLKTRTDDRLITIMKFIYCTYNYVVNYSVRSIEETLFILNYRLFHCFDIFRYNVYLSI